MPWLSWCFVVVLAGGSAWAVGSLSRRQRIAEAVHAQAEGGGQTRIRFTMFAVTALALLASQVGLEAVLATSLPFVLVAAEIGQNAGVLTARQDGALAAAGVLSVILLPTAGLSVVRRRQSSLEGR